MISFQQRQSNLISTMESKCPKVATTRWLSVETVCKWLARHCVPAREYFEEKQPAQNPGNALWIILHVVNDVMETVDICFKSLQGRDTLNGHDISRVKLHSSRLRPMMLCCQTDSNGIDVLLQAPGGGDVFLKSEIESCHAQEFYNLLSLRDQWLVIYLNLSFVLRRTIYSALLVDLFFI